MESQAMSRCSVNNTVMQEFVLCGGVECVERQQSRENVLNRNTERAQTVHGKRYGMCFACCTYIHTKTNIFSAK
jgi:hypothetical protein